MKAVKKNNIESPALEFFDKIYVINLQSRKDRLTEIIKQLECIGIDLPSNKIKIFEAIRPSRKDDWPAIGAKGCFLSHFGVLKDAQKNKYEKILVLEDDVNFVENFNDLIETTINQLNNTSWDILYGGYQKSDALDLAILKVGQLSNIQSTIRIDSDINVVCSHFIAMNKSTVSLISDYFELILQRPNGHPKGGPMHVDGAYSWFRKTHPEIKTFISSPEVCYQRSSRTDIHDLKWYDSLPMFGLVTNLIRKIKNMAI